MSLLLQLLLLLLGWDVVARSLGCDVTLVTSLALPMLQLLRL